METWILLLLGLATFVCGGYSLDERAGRLSCPKNEIYKQGFPTCVFSCEKMRIKMCYKDRNVGCDCVLGYKRNGSGKCVTIAEYCGRKTPDTEHSDEHSQSKEEGAPTRYPKTYTYPGTSRTYTRIPDKPRHKETDHFNDPFNDKTMRAYFERYAKNLHLSWSPAVYKEEFKRFKDIFMKPISTKHESHEYGKIYRTTWKES